MVEMIDGMHNVGKQSLPTYVPWYIYIIDLEF